MQYKELVTRTLLTLNGPITLRSARWRCPRCGAAHLPGFAALTLPPGALTWAVAARAAHVGALLPSYARASDTLRYLSHLNISAREIELCTEGLGTAYTLPEVPPGQRGPRVDACFVEADAVLLHFRDTQPWHEEKVFCAWSQTGETLSPPRYWTADGPWVAHLAALETLVEREGLRTAPVLVCLGDGAAPLWTLLTALAPQAFQLLDWYHCQQHLAAVAKHLPDGAAWHAAQRRHLKAGAWRTVIHGLAHLARTGPTPEARQEARACCGYLFRHRRRLDYRTAEARGYPIGSGRIESACKLVVQQRCKGPGMRWEHQQAEAVLHARCAWLNDDWPRAVRLWRATGRLLPPQEVRTAA
jgi:hypothetical protein